MYVLCIRCISTFKDSTVEKISYSSVLAPTPVHPEADGESSLASGNLLHKPRQWPVKCALFFCRAGSTSKISCLLCIRISPCFVRGVTQNSTVLFYLAHGCKGFPAIDSCIELCGHLVQEL